MTRSSLVESPMKELSCVRCQVLVLPKILLAMPFHPPFYSPPGPPGLLIDSYQKSLIQLPVAYWFALLGAQMRNFKHHVLSLKPPSGCQIVSPSERATLRGRCMQIQALKVFPIEVIVRGYLIGSAWNE